MFTLKQNSPPDTDILRESMFFKAEKEERGKRRENSGKNPIYLYFKYSVVERLSEIFLKTP